MSFKKNLLLLITICFAFLQHAYAEKNQYPKVYPFVPFKVSEIKNSIKNLSEDKNYILNFNDIISMNLSRAKTTIKPWTNTYWPLNKGLIADPYENSFVGYYVERGVVSWTKNYNTFQARKRGILKNIDLFTQGQLATLLAPSEKYDLLLGDRSFNLTNKLWDYMKVWGEKKEFGFLSKLAIVGEDSLDIARQMVSFGWYNTVDEAFADAYQLRGSLVVDEALRLIKEGKFKNIEKAMPLAIKNALHLSKNYVLEKRNNLMAFWEGICHGWATASGVIPRPKKAVSIELPDGRFLTFYPTDIKALISLLWANSLIQDPKLLDNVTGKNIGGGVTSEGLRCNLKNPQTDEWNRLYDSSPDPFTNKLAPRCVGVHPGIWHLALVNIIGKQGRSFIVERKVGEEVDNHPMYSYSMKYFNPSSAESFRTIEHNIEPITNDDPFKSFRSPHAKYIVGVETTMTYIDWARPQRFNTDDERFDKTDTKLMFYDLELDSKLNIVGGQWRISRNNEWNWDPDDAFSESGFEINHNQPDFFWVISKNWKPFFKETPNLEEWTDTSLAPPASWKAAAKIDHDFLYQEKYKFSKGRKCNMIHKKTGAVKEVSCEFEIPKPQPLLNLVNKLIDLSSQ